MTAVLWGVLVAAIIGLIVIKRMRHISPDCVVVSFADGRRNQVKNWQRGGLLFHWPWDNIGDLPMQAMSITLNVTEPPLCLTEGESLRFMCAIGENDRDITRAAVAFADKSTGEISALLKGVILRHLEGLQVSAVRVNRKHFENILVQGIRESLEALGVNLLSFNMDGIFGDAPEVKYCVAEEGFGG